MAAPLLSGAIAAGLNVVAEILKMINTAQSRKYIDRIVEIRTELFKEREKGYDSDDSKIESLYKELEIVMQAANAEIVSYGKKIKE